MRLLSFILGLIITVFGVLFIIAPKLLIRAGEILNQTFTVDEKILSKRIVIGILLILVGAYLYYRSTTF